MTLLSRAGSTVANLGDEVAHGSRLLMWRMLFWVLAGGAVFSLVGRLLFPHERGELAVGLVIAATATVIAVVLRLVPERLPAWVAHPIVAGCTVAISAEIHANERASNDDELFYLWVTLFAFYFFERRQALAHMAFIAVAYWLAIFLETGAMPADRLRWLVTITTLTIAGLVVEHLTRRQRATIEQLSQAVRSDPLTGLLNRKGFQEAFEAALSTAQRRGASFGVIIGDVDRFKRVNDRLGHAGGDETLRTVARLLSSSTRGGDRPARLGGEEFALLVPDADRTQTYAAAERLRLAVEREFANTDVPVTISFGLCVYPRDGTTPNQLMLLADQALYAAKEAGRNRTMPREDFRRPP